MVPKYLELRQYEVLLGLADDQKIIYVINPDQVSTIIPLGSPIQAAVKPVTLCDSVQQIFLDFRSDGMGANAFSCYGYSNRDLIIPHNGYKKDFRQFKDGELWTFIQFLHIPTTSLFWQDKEEQYHCAATEPYDSKRV